MAPTTTAATDAGIPPWEREVRQLEEEARVAFLNSDIATLTRLWADTFTVNSPLERIIARPAQLVSRDTAAATDRRTLLEPEAE